MERTKTLPPGTYWCRKLGRFVCPGDPAYKSDALEEYTLGPLERGCFGDEADTGARDVRAARALPDCALALLSASGLT